MKKIKSISAMLFVLCACTCIYAQSKLDLGKNRDTLYIPTESEYIITKGSGNANKVVLSSDKKLSPDGPFIITNIGSTINFTTAVLLPTKIVIKKREPFESGILKPDSFKLVGMLNETRELVSMILVYSKSIINIKNSLIEISKSNIEKKLKSKEKKPIDTIKYSYEYPDGVYISDILPEENWYDITDITSKGDSIGSFEILATKKILDNKSTKIKATVKFSNGDTDDIEIDLTFNGSIHSNPDIEKIIFFSILSALLGSLIVLGLVYLRYNSWLNKIRVVLENSITWKELLPHIEKTKGGVDSKSNEEEKDPSKKNPQPGEKETETPQFPDLLHQYLNEIFDKVLSPYDDNDTKDPQEIIQAAYYKHTESLRKVLPNPPDTFNDIVSKAADIISRTQKVEEILTSIPDEADDQVKKIKQAFKQLLSGGNLDSFDKALDAAFSNIKENTTVEVIDKVTAGFDGIADFETITSTQKKLRLLNDFLKEKGQPEIDQKPPIIDPDRDDQHSNLKDEIENLKKNVGNLNQEKQSLKEHFQGELDNANTSIGLLTSEKLELDTQLKNKLTELDNANTSIGLLTSEKLELDTQLKNKLTELDNANTSIGLLTSEKLELEAQLKNKLTELDNANTNIGLLTSEKLELDTQLKNKLTELDNANTSIGLLTSEKLELDTQLKNKLTELDNANTSIGLLTSEKLELDTQLKNKLTELDNANTSIGLLTSEKLELNTQLKNKLTELDNANTNIGLLTSEKLELDTELKNKLTELDNANTNIGLLTSEKLELDTQLKNKLTELDNANNHIEILKQERQDLTNRLRTTTHQRDTTNTQLIQELEFIVKISISKNTKIIPDNFPAPKAWENEHKAWMDAHKAWIERQLKLYAPTDQPAYLQANPFEDAERITLDYQQAALNRYLEKQQISKPNSVVELVKVARILESLQSRVENILEKRRKGSPFEPLCQMLDKTGNKYIMHAKDLLLDRARFADRIGIPLEALEQLTLEQFHDKFLDNFLLIGLDPLHRLYAYSRILDLQRNELSVVKKAFEAFDLDVALIQSTFNAFHEELQGYLHVELVIPDLFKERFDAKHHEFSVSYVLMELSQSFRELREFVPQYGIYDFKSIGVKSIILKRQIKPVVMPIS